MLIAQISDPHARPRDRLYQGLVDSNAIFEAAIRHLNGLTPRPDLVILTGDVVDEGTPAEYTVAREILSQLQMPFLVIPGNHDEREAFRESFSDHDYLPKTGALHFVSGGYGPVRIVALDVTLPGLHHGLVDEVAIHIGAGERTGWPMSCLATPPWSASFAAMFIG
jgi:Icc protein